MYVILTDWNLTYFETGLKTEKGVPVDINSFCPDPRLTLPLNKKIPVEYFVFDDLLNCGDTQYTRTLRRFYVNSIPYTKIR